MKRRHGGLLLLVEFDRFYTPAISKIEGKRPRIILKIKNASSFKKDWAAIHTGGHLIRGIRSSMDPQTREASIVLDMAAFRDAVDEDFSNFLKQHVRDFLNMLLNGTNGTGEWIPSGSHGKMGP
jgi:hypothetical protein